MCFLLECTSAAQDFLFIQTSFLPLGNPRFTETARTIDSKKTEIQRQTVRALSVKLFIFSVSVQRKRKGKKKKKKNQRNILLGETLKSRDPLLREHSLKGKIRWSNLFTVLYPPPTPPPTPIKAVFLSRALRGPVLSNSLVIQSCFQMRLRVVSAKPAAAGCQDRFRGLNGD